MLCHRESLEGMWDECQKELLGVSSEEVFHFVEGFKGYFLATGSSEQEAMHRVDRLFDSYMQVCCIFVILFFLLKPSSLAAIVSFGG